MLLCPDDLHVVRNSQGATVHAQLIALTHRVDYIPMSSKFIIAKGRVAIKTSTP